MRVFSNGPTGLLGPAILPVPAQIGEAYQSWGEVTGIPGTQLIPAPVPAAVSQSYEFQALHKSSQAPPAWRPGIYYQPKLASTFAGATDSDNQMPVPALSPSPKYAIASRRPVFLGQFQIGQPVTVTNYAWRNPKWTLPS
jgi:hypothetical protein